MAVQSVAHDALVGRSSLSERARVVYLRIPSPQGSGEHPWGSAPQHPTSLQHQISPNQPNRGTARRDMLVVVSTFDDDDDEQQHWQPTSVRQHLLLRKLKRRLLELLLFIRQANRNYAHVNALALGEYRQTQCRERLGARATYYQPRPTREHAAVLPVVLVSPHAIPSLPVATQHDTAKPTT